MISELKEMSANLTGGTNRGNTTQERDKMSLTSPHLFPLFENPLTNFSLKFTVPISLVLMAGHGLSQATSTRRFKWSTPENPVNASLDIVAALRFSVGTEIVLSYAMMYVNPFPTFAVLKANLVLF